jgi:hypothetical protein
MDGWMEISNLLVSTPGGLQSKEKNSKKNLKSKRKDGWRKGWMDGWSPAGVVGWFGWFGFCFMPTDTEAY